MRNLSKIVFSEIFAPFLISLLVVTFVVFANEFGRLARLLIRQEADGLLVLRIVFSLLPGILIFSLPLSFLIGTLIGFSRLAGDSEIVALKAAGVSTWQLTIPVLKFSLLVALGTALLTGFLLPIGNWSLQKAQHDIGVRPLASRVKPRVFNEDLPNTVLFALDVDLNTSTWEGVLVSGPGEQGEKRTILAQSGRLVTDTLGQRAQLHLENGTVYQHTQENPERPNLSQFSTFDLPLPARNSAGETSAAKRLKDKTIGELRSDLLAQKPDDNHALVELHFRGALPVSAIIFAVLGVALGVRNSGGGRGYGFVAGVAAAFVYFTLTVTGTELAKSQALPVALGVWSSNLLFALTALLLLYTEHRAFSVYDSFLSPILAPIFRLFGRVFRSVLNLWREARQKTGQLAWKFPSLRFPMTRIIDLYVGRLFVTYLAMALLVCSGVFYLFTFFELITDVVANQVGYWQVFDYFIYLFPHILTLVIPICVLIATMVAFGLLDRTSQLVALKSCGISLYRLAAPVIVLALGLAGFNFVLQEHILPSANQRQDNLRNIIKGRPAQTSQPERNWIFGSENRLYNYQYFDPNRSRFADISVFRMDLAQSRLLEHIWAQRAIWDPILQRWRLFGGWLRRFDGSGQIRFERFEEKSFAFDETPNYFTREVKDSSKMAYGELEGYIQGLERRGLEVDHLKTELQKKISFPIVTLIMALVGLPFSFQLGRKGALYGVAVGVLLGIVYWGAFGLFGVLGANGFLSPFLAAWGPNLIFGAGGILSLSAVRM